MPTRSRTCSSGESLWSSKGDLSRAASFVGIDLAARRHAITADLYAHVLGDLKAEGANRLDAIFNLAEKRRAVGAVPGAWAKRNRQWLKSICCRRFAPRRAEPQGGGSRTGFEIVFRMLRLERAMSRGVWVDYALAACVALPLTACTSELPAHNTVDSAGGSGAVARFEGLRPRASWVLPEARSQNLLYVSGNAAYVYIFSFPKGKLVGTLTGFQEVAGVCADAAGNVWVANSADFDLIEYAHGGTSPIATLSDYESYPFSCSVNRQNADLAVSNIFSIKQGEVGSIVVYPSATGTPRLYTDSKVPECYFVAYGPEGKIYFDGTGYGSNFEMARLYRGRFTPIVISGATITSPGSVQYAEGSLTIGGADSAGDAIIYRITDQGVVTGETTLAGRFSCTSYEIWKTYAICASGDGNVPIYKYPAGGSPIETVGAFTNPFQVVISESRRR